MMPVFTRIILFIIIFAVAVGFLAGIVILQVFLSRRESKWPGLIMPIITFGFSLIVFMAFVLFGVVSYVGGGAHMTVDMVADLVEIVDVEGSDYAYNAGADNAGIDDVNVDDTDYAIDAHGQPSGAWVAVPTEEGTVYTQTVRMGGSIIVVWFIYFLLMNVPTIVLMLIYIACRGKQRRLMELGRMSVQDLG